MTTVLGEAITRAIEQKNSTLRCPDCQHKVVIHTVGAGKKKRVACLGNNRKCKCQTVPPSMSQLL